MENGEAVYVCLQTVVQAAQREEGLTVTNDPGALAKTNRINLLFDFYEALLTEKQQTFLKYYFHDDFSLGEIAAEFTISRQAVYEHLKRAEQALEGYESKLGLLARHGEAQVLLAELESGLNLLADSEVRKPQLLELLHRLKQTEGISMNKGGDDDGV
ncbi:DNA-binding protein [Paenibacillaceae bacterium]|nr:DNA-binding protein [Paenibacillaceae bacterium]